MADLDPETHPALRWASTAQLDQETHRDFALLLVRYSDTVATGDMRTALALLEQVMAYAPGCPAPICGWYYAQRYALGYPPGFIPFV